MSKDCVSVCVVSWGLGGVSVCIFRVPMYIDRVFRKKLLCSHQSSPCRAIMCEFSPGPEILQGCEFSFDAAKSPHMQNLTRTCKISLPAKSHLSEFSGVERIRIFLVRIRKREISQAAIFQTQMRFCSGCKISLGPAKSHL